MANYKRLYDKVGLRWCKAQPRLGIRFILVGFILTLSVLALVKRLSVDEIG